MLKQQAQLSGIQLTKTISLSSQDRPQKIFITGIPGTGVSFYLTSLLKQDINAKNPTILLDPYGNLTENLKSVLTSELKENVYFIDIGKEKQKFNLNIFEDKKESDKKEVAETIINLMYDLYDPNKTGIIGPRFEQVVRNAILTVMYDKNATFVDLVRLLTDYSYLQKLLPKVKDEFLKNYWLKQKNEISDTNKSEVVNYVISKFRPFVTDKKILPILSQSKNIFNIEKLFDNGKIVVFNFANLGGNKDTIKIVSYFLMTKLIKIFKNRNRKDYKTVSLYIDEVSFWPLASILKLCQSGRLYGINLTLTTNNISEAHLALKQELLKIENLVSFRLTTKDAKIIAEEFHSAKITDDSICMLKKYHVYIKYLRSGNPFITEKPINLEKELK